MILKFENDNNEIYLIEATSNRGVSLTKWSQISSFFSDFYDHVVLRHLESIRTDKMLDDLEGFLKEAVGLSYAIQAGALLWGGGRLSIQPKQGHYIDKDRTFFCSELVAKAYKVMGLMGDDRSSSCYAPGAFSCKGTLKLANGASLGQELVIIKE